MKSKKVIIILLILICFSIVFDIGLIIFSKKNNNEKPLSNDFETMHYECTKQENWIEFGYEGTNGEDLGKYKREYMYTFEIKEESLIQSNMKEILYFTNSYGYNTLSVELEGFTEELNETELTKTYASNTSSPVDFNAFISEEQPIEKFLNKLQEYGYTCKLVK